MSHSPHTRGSGTSCTWLGASAETTDTGCALAVGATVGAVVIAVGAVEAGTARLGRVALVGLRGAQKVGAGGVAAAGRGAVESSGIAVEVAI